MYPFTGLYPELNNFLAERVAASPTKLPLLSNKNSTRLSTFAEVTRYRISLAELRKLGALLKEGEIDLSQLNINLRCVYDRIKDLDRLCSYEDIQDALAGLKVSEPSFDELVHTCINHEDPAIRRLGCYVTLAYCAYTGQRINLGRTREVLLRIINEQSFELALKLAQAFKSVVAFQDHSSFDSVFNDETLYQHQLGAAEKIIQVLPIVLENGSCHLAVKMLLDLMREEQNNKTRRLCKQTCLKIIKENQTAGLLERLLSAEPFQWIYQSEFRHLRPLLDRIFSYPLTTPAVRQRAFELLMSEYSTLCVEQQKQHAEKVLGTVVRVLPLVEEPSKACRESVEKLLPQMNRWVQNKTGLDLFHDFIVVWNCKGYRFDKNLKRAERYPWLRDVHKLFVKEASWEQALRALEQLCMMRDKGGYGVDDSELRQLVLQFIKSAPIEQVVSLVGSDCHHHLFAGKSFAHLRYQIIRRARNQRPIHCTLLDRAIFLQLRETQNSGSVDEAVKVICRYLPKVGKPSPTTAEACKHLVSHQGVTDAMRKKLFRASIGSDKTLRLFTAAECVQIISEEEELKTAMDYYEQVLAHEWIDAKTSPDQHKTLLIKCVKHARAAKDHDAMVLRAKRLQNVSTEEEEVIAVIRVLLACKRWKDVEFLLRKGLHYPSLPTDLRGFFIWVLEMKGDQSLLNWFEKLMRTKRKGIFALLEQCMETAIVGKNTHLAFKMFGKVPKNSKFAKTDSYVQLVKKLVYTALNTHDFTARAKQMKSVLAFLEYPETETAQAAKACVERGNKEDHETTPSLLMEVEDFDAASPVWMQFAAHADLTADQAEHVLQLFKESEVAVKKRVFLTLLKNFAQAFSNNPAKHKRKVGAFLRLYRDMDQCKDDSVKINLHAQIDLPLLTGLLACDENDLLNEAAEIILGTIHCFAHLDKDRLETLFLQMVALCKHPKVEQKKKTQILSDVKDSGFFCYSPIRYARLIIDDDYASAEECCLRLAELADDLTEGQHVTVGEEIKEFVEWISCNLSAEKCDLAIRVLSHQNILKFLPEENVMGLRMLLLTQLHQNVSLLCEVLDGGAMRPFIEAIKFVVQPPSDTTCCSGCLKCHNRAYLAANIAKNLINEMAKADHDALDEFIYEIWKLIFQVRVEGVNPEYIASIIRVFVFAVLSSDEERCMRHLARSKKLYNSALAEVKKRVASDSNSENFKKGVRMLSYLALFINKKPDSDLDHLPGSLTPLAALKELVDFINTNRCSDQYLSRCVEIVFENMDHAIQDKEWLTRTIHGFVKHSKVLLDRWIMMTKMLSRCSSLSIRITDKRDYDQLRFIVKILMEHFGELSNVSVHQDEAVEQIRERVGEWLKALFDLLESFDTLSNMFDDLSELTDTQELKEMLESLSKHTDTRELKEIFESLSKQTDTRELKEIFENLFNHIDTLD